MRIRINDHRIVYGIEGAVRVKLFTGTRRAGDLIFEENPQRRFDFHPETQFLTLRFESGQRQELLELLRTRPIVNVETEGPELIFEGR